MTDLTDAEHALLDKLVYCGGTCRLTPARDNTEYAAALSLRDQKLLLMYGHRLYLTEGGRLMAEARS